MASASRMRDSADLGAHSGNTKPPVLNCWKLIAAHLNCGVRTAQRWERELGLPVYRLRDGQRGPVCAFPAELEIWLRQRRLQTSGGSPHVVPQHSRSVVKSFELTRQSNLLVQRAIVNTRLQQQYATQLVSAIDHLSAWLRKRKEVGRGNGEGMRSRG